MSSNCGVFKAPLCNNSPNAESVLSLAANAIVQHGPLHLCPGSATVLLQVSSSDILPSTPRDDVSKKQIIFFRVLRRKNIFFVGGNKFGNMKQQEKSAVKKKLLSTRILLYSTVPSLKLRYMLAEKLKDVTVATTRGRQQGDPKASGLRLRGVKGLSYFTAEAQPQAFLLLLGISAWLSY